MLSLGRPCSVAASLGRLGHVPADAHAWLFRMVSCDAVKTGEEGGREGGREGGGLLVVILLDMNSWTNAAYASLRHFVDVFMVSSVNR